VYYKEVSVVSVLLSRLLQIKPQSEHCYLSTSLSQVGGVAQW